MHKSLRALGRPLPSPASANSASPCAPRSWNRRSAIVAGKTRSGLSSRAPARAISAPTASDLNLAWFPSCARRSASPTSNRQRPYTLEFNVSDSGNSILIAWSMSGPVGVDVEALHPGGRASFLEMAGSFLSVAETAVLRSAKDDEIAAIFTRIWARKEAILKGEVGASGALRSLSVADENARGIRWFENTVVPNSDRTWEMHELNLAPGYAACRRCLRLAALHTSSPIAPRPKANSYPFEVPQSSVYDKCPRVSSTVGVVYHEMCPPRKRPTSPG